MTNSAPGILFILNSLCIGGAERHVLALLNSLDSGQFRLSLAYLKRIETLLPEVPVQRLQSLTCCDVDRKVDWKAVGILAHLISAQDIDILVCTNEYAMLYGFLARRRARRPVKIVEVFHTTMLRTAKEHLQALFYRSLFNRSDLLVYVCANQRDYWQRRGLLPDRAVVIYNGVDCDHFSDRYSPAEKNALRHRFGFLPSDYLIGICAVLRPEKAQGDLLQSLARLKAAGLPAKALLIGDGPERERLESHIAALDLRNDVAITGLQSDIRPYVSGCDVMVLTSHAIETFSISALESMALGKPLILTNIGGASEQITPGTNGFLIEPGDIDALFSRLIELAEPQKRDLMGQAAAKIVRERFTRQQMTASFSAQLTALAPVHSTPHPQTTP